MNINTNASIFLTHNPSIAEFVVKTGITLETNSHVTSVDIELYHDYDEGWEKIFICCNNTITDMEELLTVEDELFDKHFLPYTHALGGKVVLSMV